MIGRKGAALRQAIAEAADFLGELGGAIVFGEPEKVDLVRLVGTICDPILSGETDIVNPTRENGAFAATYAIEQVHSETFANLFFNTAARAGGLKLTRTSADAAADARSPGGVGPGCVGRAGELSPGVDWTFGPFAFRADLAAWWVAHDGAMWTAQIAPMIRAHRFGGARLSATLVDYRHPDAARAEEEDDAGYGMKRLHQLDTLFPALRREWTASAVELEVVPPPAGAAAADAAAAKPPAPPGEEEPYTVLITGAAGNLGTKLALHLLDRTLAAAAAAAQEKDGGGDGGGGGGEERRRYAVVLVDVVYPIKLLGACAVRAKARGAPASVLDAFARAVVCDLSQWGGGKWAREAFGGAQRVDAVVHFAAQNPYPAATWTDAQKSFDITANIAKAACDAGVARLVFASSNHVQGRRLQEGPTLARGGAILPDGIDAGLAREQQHADAPYCEARPGTRYTLAGGFDVDATPYATAKLFGERACRAAAAQQRRRAGKQAPGARLTRVVVLRIGWCQPGENHPATMNAAGTTTLELPVCGEGKEAPAAAAAAAAGCDDMGDVESWFRHMWLSNADLLRVVDRAMHAQFDKAEDGTRFCIVNAMSNNTGMRWSLERGRHLLGYEPQDDVAQHIELDD